MAIHAVSGGRYVGSIPLTEFPGPCSSETRAGAARGVLALAATQQANAGHRGGVPGCHPRQADGQGAVLPKGPTKQRPAVIRQRTVGSCDACERGWAAGAEAGRGRALGAETTGRGMGMGAEVTGRGEGTKFLELLDCSISCSFVISRVICS